MKKAIIKDILKGTVIFSCLIIAPLSSLCLWSTSTSLEEVEGKNIQLVKKLDIANERILNQDYDIEQLELKNKMLNGDNILIDMGEFLTTGYCNCEICCGKWAGGPTKSGKMPKEGRTVAVDPTVIPLGSEVIIEGKSYIAEDTGRLIKGNRIDVYYNSHEKALKHDMGYRHIYVKIK